MNPTSAPVPHPDAYWHRRCIQSTSLAASLLGAVLAVCTAPVASGDSIIEGQSLTEIESALNARTLTSEQLVRHSLERIAAYDKQGPHLNAVLSLDPKALDVAKALDVERRTRGPRSKLHGIPVLLKDNIDTANLPTTAGSLMLEGSIPPDDAAVTRKLRAAGAIILGKLNMSEFALGGAFSSLGGQMRNPHDLTRSPAGSSGGSGVAIAAAYAPLALDTDTCGSIRMPAAANGIVGLKPTYGLISRDGIVPLALTLDTVGPMALHVSDVAAALDVLAGPDAADPATQRQPRRAGSYQAALDKNALRGARIGVVRNFIGENQSHRWIVEASLSSLREQGAVLVDVEFPAWLMGDALASYYMGILGPEFSVQIGTYLATLQSRYPKTVQELLTAAQRFNAPREDGAGPNPQRWSRMAVQAGSVALDDYRYTVIRDRALPLVRAVVEGMMSAHSLDALLYPTTDTPADLIVGRDDDQPQRPYVDCIANLTGAPELAIPAGFTVTQLPYSLSLLGKPFDEARLLALGYSFEQATRARRLPRHTPPLGR